MGSIREAGKMITLKPYALHEVCDFCKDLDPSFTPDQSGGYNLKQIQTGADGGCPRLQLLLACREWAVPKLFPEEKAKFASIRQDGRVHIFPDESRFWAGVLHIDCSIVDESNELVAFDPTSGVSPRLLPSRTSSQKTVENIKAWIDDCQTNHQACRHDRSGRRADLLHQVRFLEICRSSNILKLTTNIIPESYACLSHCWGEGLRSPLATRTVESNFNSRMTGGIELNSLPKTFQDAVQLCFSLNINYIWIDSLCIVQDNPSDWATQASLMASVYESALLTIAATKARDASEGCFSSVDESIVGQRVPGYANVHLRRRPDEPFTITPKNAHDAEYSFSKNEKQWPLLTRGWVYQEMRLSKRVVHFGEQQVFWVCHGLSAKQSQIGPSDYAYGFVANETSHESSQSQWYEAVTTFTSKHLSEVTDRLPAIAAIARELFENHSHQYCAGLVKDSLLEDLFWVAPRKISLVGFPTWSWASARGCVEWTLKGSGPYRALRNVQVEHFEVIPVVSGTRWTGPFEKATITMTAPLIRYNTLCERHDTRSSGCSAELEREVLKFPSQRSWNPILNNPYIHNERGFTDTDDLHVIPLLIRGCPSDQRDEEHLGKVAEVHVLVVKKRQGTANEYEKRGTAQLRNRGLDYGIDYAITSNKLDKWDPYDAYWDSLALYCGQLVTATIVLV